MIVQAAVVAAAAAASESTEQTDKRMSELLSTVNALVSVLEVWCVRVNVCGCMFICHSFVGSPS